MDQKTADPAGAVGTRHIVIVDDDPDLASLAQAMLEEAGHRVEVLTDSTEAAEAIARMRPDAVMLDLMMPGLDGFGLCRRLRDNPALDAMRIIIVSGKVYEHDRRRALAMGADGYITKPISRDRFATQVERIIQDRMEVRYWGVRGTLPVPGPKSLKYGGNTSCLTVELARGSLFIFDAGSGIKALSDHLVANKRARELDAKIFISHPHWDHINALPFFAPLYMPGNEFEILGASHGDIDMRHMISAQMDGVYFPIRIKEFGSRVSFRDLEEESLEIDGVTIRTKLLNHPGKCLGYRVEYKGRSLCYVTDNELYLPDSEHFNPYYLRKLTDFVRGTDVLVTDTTYTDAEYASKVGWGHACVSQVVELAHAAEVKELHLFHHDPDQDDAAIDAKLATARDMLAALGSATRVEAPAEGTTLVL